MSAARRVFVIARAVALTGVGLVVALGVASLPLFVFPAHDAPSPSDALVVLGPVKDRMPMAMELMDEGISSTLVVVSPVLENGRFETDLCNSPSSVPYEVLCFSAVPTTTRGEARGFGTLAEAHGWDSVMVLTFTPQIARARLIMQRCFPGEITMIEYRPDLDLGEWAYQALYQYGGFAKVFTETGC